MQLNERNHDLALLFLKNQDLSNINPTQLAEMYVKARKEIAESLKDF